MRLDWLEGFVLLSSLFDIRTGAWLKSSRRFFLILWWTEAGGWLAHGVKLPLHASTSSQVIFLGCNNHILG